MTLLETLHAADPDFSRMMCRAGSSVDYVLMHAAVTITGRGALWALRKLDRFSDHHRRESQAY
jgi:hypothetical protein